MILKNKIITELPVGSLVKVLDVGDFQFQIMLVCANIERQEMKWFVSIDTGLVSNEVQSFLWNIEVLRLGTDNKLLSDNGKIVKCKINLLQNSKLAVVKAVKELTGLGLKEAKDLVDDGFAKGSRNLIVEISELKYTLNEDYINHNTEIIEIMKN